MQVPTTVLLYGAVTPDPGTQEGFTKGYNVIERIQLVVFALQECLLSCIYIWETFNLLRLRPQHAHRVILVQLLVINIVILALDVVVVVLQFAGLFVVQVAFKPVAYSIKLRLEFAILGRLVQIAGVGPGSQGGGNGNGNGNGSSVRALSDGAGWPGLAGEYSRGERASGSSGEVHT